MSRNTSTRCVLLRSIWAVGLVVGTACVGRAIAEGWNLTGSNWAPQVKTVKSAEPQADNSSQADKGVSPLAPAVTTEPGETASQPLSSAYRLGDALGKGLVALRLAGLNNDVEMSLSLENLTKDEVSVRVPEGTVFLPANSAVQRMLLRNDAIFRLPARKTSVQRVLVLCMDVAKDPPSVRDTGWTHSFDAEMSKLVTFTKKAAAEESARRSDVTPDQVEHFLLRFVVWRQNGATAADFTEFIRKYGSADEKADAERRGQELAQTADRVLSRFRGRQ